MRFSTMLRASACALALAAMGCGDSTGPAISLTTGEVNELFDEIGGVLSGSAVFAKSTPGLSLSRTPRIDLNSAVSISESFNCPNGGTATVSGSSTLSDAAAGSADVTASFSSCKTSHYTLGGSFSLSVTASSTTINETASGDINVTRTSDGRTGNCHVDFSVAVQLGGSSGVPSATVSGTVCGVAANGISGIQ